jgi:hypothetical protein
MATRPEVGLTLEPLEGESMPVMVVNMGGFTCPPFSFVAILRGEGGYIRPVRFDTVIDMKPGDRFRFELRLKPHEQLTVKFDRSVDLYFKDELTHNNTIEFPRT